MKRRPKIQCEVCGEKDVSTLERHHIVPQTDLNTDNSDFNIAILCANCHKKFHANVIKIIGVFPGTSNPSGKILVFINEDGICNFPALKDAKPYYTPRPKSMSLKEEK